MYLYSIPHEGKYIVYRPLLPLAFIANAGLVNLISRMQRDPSRRENEPSEAIRFLEKIGFWVPDPLPERSPSVDDPYTPTTAVLFLTNACNLRCVYCYASGGEEPVRRLPLELGKRAIDRVYAHAREMSHDRFTVAFHGGGEPMCAWELMRDLVEYARGKSLPCRVDLASNGVLSEEQAEWVLSNVDNVSLSVDGVQEVHDRQRPRVTGRGSLEAVRKSIAAMDSKALAYGIRMTVIDEGIEDLVESVEYLCRSTGCRTFQVEPAFGHGRAGRDGYALTRTAAFAHAFMQAHDVAESYGKRLYYSGARPWTKTRKFCSAQETALVVTPDGQLTACYEVCGKRHPLWSQMRYGSIHGDGTLSIDGNARRAFLHKVEERRRLCETCFCFWHCAGDCPSKTFGQNGDEHLKFGERCELNRMVTKELLVRAIDRAGGLWQGHEEQTENMSEVM